MRPVIKDPVEREKMKKEIRNRSNGEPQEPQTPPATAPGETPAGEPGQAPAAPPAGDTPQT